ncbi:MAG TPA: alpha/beta hydrolase [Dehalococcoidia bacterium]|nr:alpha/beta hydrolase [Dehalococcoidia bacterium]
MNPTKALYYVIAALLLLGTLAGCGPEETGTNGEAPYTPGEHEVSFQTEDSSLAGTLVIPEGEGPFPAVIVIAGSGAFDRDGDVDARVALMQMAMLQPVMAANSTYRDIAEALSDAGMVTLRYDKRGVGSSTGEDGDFPEPSLRDLRAAVAFLRESPPADPGRIALVGHSLGGLWALMNAVEDPGIAAVCLMATPAKPMGEVIIEQITGLMELAGANETSIAALVVQQQAIYAVLRSKVEGSGNLTGVSGDDLRFLAAIIDVAGADYARKIECPALIIQGDKDLFTVIPEEAELLREAFIGGGNEDVELILFPDLDHLFRPTPGQPSVDLYYVDRGPIAPEVVEAIVDWMQATLQ